MLGVEGPVWEYRPLYSAAVYKESVRLGNTTGAFRWINTESLQVGLPASMLSMLNIPAGITHGKKMFGQKHNASSPKSSCVVLSKMANSRHTQSKFKNRPYLSPQKSCSVYTARGAWSSLDDSCL